MNKVVVCDDEDAIAHLVTMVLGDAGYLCLRARDGEQAMFLAAHEHPDLLILDVMMPKLDGIQACRRLRADAQLAHIPVLMLTSLGSTDDKVKGLEAGADDYLPKPFDLRELTARVKALIRAARRASAVSPTTGLPGATALEESVEAFLADKQPFVILHASLRGYDTYVEEHGWRQGDELVAAAARGLSGVVPRLVEGAVVTHLGGGDFGVVARAGTDLAGPMTDAVTEATAGFGDSRVRLVVTSIEGSAASTVDGLARALASARKRDRRSTDV